MWLVACNAILGNRTADIDDAASGTRQVYDVAHNLVAIATNGGRMPVDAALLTQTRGPAFAQAVAQHRVATNAVIADSATRLSWLTDRFVLPPPLPSPVVFSIGDLLIGAGVVWLVAAGMRSAMQAER